MRYSAYMGKDPTSLFGACPVTRGTMPKQDHAVPIYRSWPSEHYQVIGSVRLENPNLQWDEGDFAQAARKAKRHRANAIIMRHGSEFGFSKSLAVSKIVGTNDDAKVPSEMIRLRGRIYGSVWSDAAGDP
jgi:hypothetical protein